MKPHYALQVAGLSHRYGRDNQSTVILNDVSLTVNLAESVALLGRSGSGKSTLLNLLSGLEPITQGDVQVANHSLRSLNDNQRTRLRSQQIGFVYQAFNLIPTLNVADNIVLPLALSGVSRKLQQEKVTTMLSAVGLKGRAGDYPDRLSGGEQQRVAVARALINSPALILADEPTGNLDASSGRQVLELLNDLVKRKSAAMLLVTHSLEVAKTCHRIVTLDQQQVRAVAPEDLALAGAW